MEVDVKLRQSDFHSHQKLSDLLSSFHTKTHLQENLFFVTPNFKLASNLPAPHLRFYDLDSRCIISLKAKPVISIGISRIEEDEEPIDLVLANDCVAEPWWLLLIDSSRIVSRVRDEYGIGENEVMCLGGFKNVRAVYELKGLKLELDETQFDFVTKCEFGSDFLWLIITFEAQNHF